LKIKHAGDFQVVAIVSEEDPVILGAPADERCKAIGFSTPRISALACSVQTIRLAIPMGRRFFWRRLLAHFVPIGYGQAELGKNNLMRNWFMVLEPFIGFVHGSSFGTAQRISIFVGRDHSFEQMNDSGELAGLELVQQLMGVLFIDGHCVSHADDSTRSVGNDKASLLRILSKTITKGQADSRR